MDNQRILDIENKYYKSNLIVAGVDEAGRGPLAGAVVAAAVVVDKNNIIEGIKDSKKLSKKSREDLYNKIVKSYKYGLGIVSVQEIDEINILNATIKACNLAVLNLSINLDVVLVDGNMKFTDRRFISIIKGDSLCFSISAASIVAKVTRDKIMHDLSLKYPEYLWHKNCGYGTKEHIEMIKKYGATEYHRKSFLKNII